MTETGVVILGSSRSRGNTYKSVEYFSQISGFQIIDLNRYHILPYDYAEENRDDFIDLMEHLIIYPVWIFASPVYWYSMSGQMKIFMDRFTDLLKGRKDLGYLLKNKAVGVISSASDEKRNEGFIEPFVLSSNYLGMNFIGDAHTWLEGDDLSHKSLENLDKLHHLINQSH